MIMKKRIWPPCPYWGGKHYATPRLMSLIPPNTTRVISPFTGGGALEATLAYHGVEVEGGDVFEPVANFWTCAVHNNMALRTLIETIGEPGKDKWLALQRDIDHGPPLAQAAAFWIVASYSFAGMAFSGGGYFHHPHRRFGQATDKLERFDGLPIDVDHATFVETLEWGADECLDALVYADPPYDGMEAMYGRKRQWDVIDQDELAYYLAPFNQWLLTTTLTPQIRRLYRGAYIVDLTHFNPAYSFNQKTRKTARDVALLSPGLARAVPRLIPLDRIK